MRGSAGSPSVGAVGASKPKGPGPPRPRNACHDACNQNAHGPKKELKKIRFCCAGAGSCRRMLNALCCCVELSV
eukprot:7671-Chlamydomonas_euryale.AAC.9